ncbi:MAG: hypothetical protein IT210_21600 [Armatimonadetes bacterium]|nr:hypothetical protein [Armatimonadota bacterium]
MSLSLSVTASERSYRFEKTISRKVLENYLSRAATLMDLCTGQGNVEDNIRMVIETGTKFAGRTLYLWGGESQLEARMARAKEIAARIHRLDPDLVLQAGIFEIVTEEANGVAVPDWVFREFKLPVEQRNFRYQAMLFDEGLYHNHWSAGASVPDMSKLETRMWFYYLAARYIDAGMEAIHFGQVALIGAKDPGFSHWWDMLTRTRRYARQKARRHLLICDAHTPDGGPKHGDRLLFDFHSFPLRIKEIADAPHKGVLEVGYLDSIFGRSKGGIAPSGWKCDHLPYLVELDNYGISDRPGQPGASYYTFGYDEITWFAHQPESYRNEWLRYAWQWVREHDKNGYLQMPGSRCLSAPINGQSWYYANTRSAACPQGFGQEKAIKAIWSETP